MKVLLVDEYVSYVVICSFKMIKEFEQSLIKGQKYG